VGDRGAALRLNRAVCPALTVEGQAQLNGDALWSRDPDSCCAIRKVEPQRQFLSGYDAWITGIRRDQTSARASQAAISWDEQFQLAKITPLVEWDETMVWTYIRAHGVPYNALHERNYPSLGCVHCTRTVAPGEDARAGRWPGFTKTECGLHINTMETQKK